MKRSKNNILVIPDLQLPAMHKDALAFLDAVADKYNCGKYIQVGDLLDNNFLSSYQRDPSTESSLTEITRVREQLSLLGAMFPNTECVLGNHENRIRRKLDEAGFPQEVIATEDIMRQVHHFPSSWSVHDVLKLDTQQGPVMVMHGDEMKSTIRPGTTMKEVGCSLIRGHFDTSFFLWYNSTKFAIRFDMVVGCLIDKNAVNFRYNRRKVPRPILGCAVLIDGMPQLVYMRLDSNSNWVGTV